MDAASDIAIIRTRLPYIDRGALSQAWYSALRYVADGTLPERKTFLRHGVAAERCVGLQARRLGSGTPISQARLSAVKRKPNLVGRPSGESRNCRNERSPAPLNVGGPPQRVSGIPHAASFTIAMGEARVRIVVRSDGKRLQLTAICSANHAETVRRALAHASAGLRLYGAAVETAVHCEDVVS